MMIKGFVSTTVVLTIVTGITVEGPPSSLEEAARRGDVKALRGFLEEGASLEADEITTSAVGYALIHNRMDMYRYLCDVHGADVNCARGPARWTALNHAINSRKIANVREVIDDGASLEAKIAFDCNPLLQSIHSGDVDVIRELINRGADINVRDGRGFNPLMAAIFYRRREIALELIALGSAVNVRQIKAREETPLTLAVDRGWEDVASALVEAGANVDAGDYEETTPLILAVKKGYLGIVRMLIANHADVYRISTCNGKYSAILAAHIIAKREINMELTRLLLEEGNADPNLIHPYGMTLLHRIAQSGIKGVARLLIQFGADVNRRDHAGRTPQDVARYTIELNARRGKVNPDLDDEWVAEFGP